MTDPRDSACPTCGAGPRASCNNARGYPRRGTHADRGREPRRTGAPTNLFVPRRTVQSGQDTSWRGRNPDTYGGE